jgi:hypothetical protein
MAPAGIYFKVKCLRLKLFRRNILPAGGAGGLIEGMILKKGTP